MVRVLKTALVLGALLVCTAAPARAASLMFDDLIAGQVTVTWTGMDNGGTLFHSSTGGFGVGANGAQTFVGGGGITFGFGWLSVPQVFSPGVDVSVIENNAPGVVADYAFANFFANGPFQQMNGFYQSTPGGPPIGTQLLEENDGLMDIADALANSDSTGLQFLITTDNDGQPPIPEPASMLLLGSGLAGLVGRRLRARAKR